MSPDCRQGNTLQYLETSQESEGEEVTLNLCPLSPVCLSAALWDFALSSTEDREIRRSFPREDRDAAGCDQPQLPKPVSDSLALSERVTDLPGAPQVEVRLKKKFET